MKKRSPLASIRPGGILRWSTTCILAGGVVGLSSCQRPDDYVATEKDLQMAEAQSRIEQLDSQQELLKNGEVANNFHLPGVGYYHAEAHDFFDHPYQFSNEGRFFVNGVWQDQPGREDIEPSRPSPAALKKVDQALAREQQLAQGSAPSQGGGFGMGNMLMMYWLLSGNRGMFSPGAGFRNAGPQVGNWQNSVENQRRAVNAHASANPGYNRMVNQSRMRGAAVQPGQSVRGGFGGRSSGFSFGG
jgi:hypothetical protein